MGRVEGERARLEHALARLMACAESLEIVLLQTGDGVPPGHDAANALMQTAFEIGLGLAKLDAYMRVEGKV